jgi:hypothetical protein
MESHCNSWLAWIVKRWNASWSLASCNPCWHSWLARIAKESNGSDFFTSKKLVTLLKMGRINFQSFLDTCRYLKTRYHKDQKNSKIKMDKENIVFILYWLAMPSSHLSFKPGLNKILFVFSSFLSSNRTFNGMILKVWEVPSLNNTLTLWIKSRQESYS